MFVIDNFLRKVMNGKLHKHSGIHRAVANPGNRKKGRAQKFEFTPTYSTIYKTRDNPFSARGRKSHLRLA